MSLSCFTDTYDVQSVSGRVIPGGLELSCTFAEGSQAQSCIITLHRIVENGMEFHCEHIHQQRELLGKWTSIIPWTWSSECVHYNLLCVLMYWILLVIRNLAVINTFLFWQCYCGFLLAIPPMPIFDPEHMRIMGHVLKIIGTFLGNFRRWLRIWE